MDTDALLNAKVTVRNNFHVISPVFRGGFDPGTVDFDFIGTGCGFRK